MLFSKSSCVCYHVLSFFTPRVCMAKLPFLAFLGPDMSTEMGMIIYMYSKHSPDYIDSKYIYIHIYMGSLSNSLGSSVFFTDIPFLALIALHRERLRCGQEGHSPYHSQSEVVCAYQVLNL